MKVRDQLRVLLLRIHHPFSHAAMLLDSTSLSAVITRKHTFSCLANRFNLNCGFMTNTLPSEGLHYQWHHAGY